MEHRGAEEDARDGLLGIAAVGALAGAQEGDPAVHRGRAAPVAWMYRYRSGCQLWCKPRYQNSTRR